MDALRCPPGDADVTKLSGGELREGFALCRLVARTSGHVAIGRANQPLDAESVAWLERYLKEYEWHGYDCDP